MAKFLMKGDYYELIIKIANADKIDIEITFKEKEIPEQDLRNLEQSLRLLLQACGRYNPNPSRR